AGAGAAAGAASSAARATQVAAPSAVEMARDRSIFFIVYFCNFPASPAFSTRNANPPSGRFIGTRTAGIEGLCTRIVNCDRMKLSESLFNLTAFGGQQGGARAR